MNYELNKSELKLNWKLIETKLKLSTWMNIQMNDLHSISIFDNGWVDAWEGR